MDKAELVHGHAVVSQGRKKNAKRRGQKRHSLELALRKAKVPPALSEEQWRAAEDEEPKSKMTCMKVRFTDLTRYIAKERK